MKNVFIALIVLSLAAPAFAAKWINIGNDQFLQIQKIRANQIFYTLKVPEKATKQSPYDVIYQVSDCKIGATKPLSIQIYTPQGALIKGANLYNGWQKPTHHSRCENWQKLACHAWSTMNRHY